MINFKLFLKGAAMGCADLIPGVSGGTIALITGIYEELINSIKSADGRALKLLYRLKFKELWNHINGVFLLHVFGGILLSIFSLSQLISLLLENHPIPLWSFFFGLILISAFYVIPKRTTITSISFVIIGAFIAYLITSLTPSETSEQLWFIFLSGAIAICAMILPGISGSFILILLAKYEFILNSVKEFDLKIIIIFGLGCATGLLSFSKLIHWLLQKHKAATMAALAGFMLGSLNKIWPWKTVTENSFKNISPAGFTELNGDPNELMSAIVFCVIGGVLVVILERLGRVAE
jgi:putative membrane protein